MKISRSFSKKIQIEEYEPIEAFCAIEAETDIEGVQAMSRKLFDMCVEEVEKDIARKVDEKKNAVSIKKEKVEKKFEPLDFIDADTH